MIDLWPDSIEVSKETMPVTILRQQAAILGRKTNNLVEAEVIVEEFEPKRQFFFSGDFEFGYGFYILAPALNNYRYLLFRVFYNIELYPLFIRVEDDIIKEISQQTKIAPTLMSDEDIMGAMTTWASKEKPITSIKVVSEEKFLEVLRAIFNSSKAKKVISVILAQSDPNFKSYDSDDDEDES